MKTPPDKLAYIIEWARKNREKTRRYKTKWRLANKVAMDKARKAWADTHYSQIRRAAQARRVCRYRDDPQFRIESKARAQLGRWLKRRGTCRSGGKLETLAGASKNKVRAYLERLFTTGMSWANYGYRGWHIHHKVPVSRFDLTDLDQLRACFNYRNWQPLWNDDHIRRHGGVPKARNPVAA